MKNYIAEQGSLLPVLSTILFLTIFVVVLILLATDRRVAHRRRMEAMALDDDGGCPR
jgi:hypothetical protein